MFVIKQPINQVKLSRLFVPCIWDVSSLKTLRAEKNPIVNTSMEQYSAGRVVRCAICRCAFRHTIQERMRYG